jgi:hypothetical protein
MRLYLISYAGYYKNGDLYTSASVYKTLKEAKKQMEANYKDLYKPFEDDDYVDEDAWISDNKMACGSSGSNQSLYEIVGPISV